MTLRKALFQLLALVTVLAALAGLLWYLRFSDEMRMEQERQAQRMFTFDRDDINQLRFFGEAGAIYAEKIEGRWMITHPVETEGDIEGIDRFLAEMAETRKSKDPVAEALSDHPRFGLDSPALRIEVKEDNGIEHQVSLGNTSPGGETYRYAVRDTDPNVYLVSVPLFNRLNRQLYDFRDKQVLGFDPYQVKEIEATTQDGLTMSFGRDEENLFRIRSPVVARADSDQLERYIDLFAIRQRFSSSRPKDIVRPS